MLDFGKWIVEVAVNGVRAAALTGRGRLCSSVIITAVTGSRLRISHGSIQKWTNMRKSRKRSAMS